MSLYCTVYQRYHFIPWNIYLGHLELKASLTQYLGIIHFSCHKNSDFYLRFLPVFSQQNQSSTFQSLYCFIFQIDIKIKLLEYYNYLSEESQKLTRTFLLRTRTLGASLRQMRILMNIILLSLYLYFLNPHQTT